MENKKIAIGVDIGGTSIKGAAIKEDGEVLGLFSLPVNKGDSQEQTVQNLIGVLNRYLKDNNYNKDNILGIGLGIPGVIDTKAGVVSYSNNLRWNELPIKKMLEDATHLPIRITNDANAAALGEAKFGAGKKYNDLLMITLGTGVGGGIIINKKVYEGNLGKGAELGHTVVVIDGEECTCGRKGCLEAYASATGLIRETKKAMEEHKDSIMWELASKKGKVDASIAFDGARANDKYAIHVVDNYIKYLGEGLLNFFNIFRPEALVLSGGIANEKEYLTSRLEKYVADRHYGFRGTPKVDILISELGYDSGKIGAAALFFD